MQINKDEVRNRFRRSVESYEENARIQKMVVNRLMRITTDTLRPSPRKILEVGCGTGLLTRELAQQFPGAMLYINDLVEEMCRHASEHCHLPSDAILPGDIEEIPLPEIFDLIVSASTLQWLSDPGSTFRKLAGQLNPDGLLIFSTYGKYNLREIRLTTGGGLNYRSQEEIMDLLEPWFQVEQIHEEFHLMEFSDPLAILQHLKKTGVNVSGGQAIWTKGRLGAFIKEYNNRFALDGEVTLTYHPLYFVCRKL